MDNPAEPGESKSEAESQTIQEKEDISQIAEDEGPSPTTLATVVNGLQSDLEEAPILSSATSE